MSAIKQHVYNNYTDPELVPPAWPDYTGKLVSDPVNSPAHYTQGSVEVIDIIENAVIHAPEPVAAGLQWNIIKYVMRCWHKGNALQDLKKAQWYLNRLVDRLEEHES